MSTPEGSRRAAQARPGATRRCPQPAVPDIVCVVSPTLAPEMLDSLARRCAGAASIVVEQRWRDRRRPADRRGEAAAAVAERRRVHNEEGRRVSDRRAIVVAVGLPGLPAGCDAHADTVRFFERLRVSALEIDDRLAAETIIRFQAGDRGSFSDLYVQYFDRIHACLRTMLGDGHTAEDAAQQVFMKLFVALPRYRRTQQPFRSYLFTIARNHALTVLGKRGRSEPLEPEQLAWRLESGATPDDGLPSIADPELARLLGRLPHAQQQVLLLRFSFDLPHSEIAAILGRTPEDSRQLQRRALSTLRAQLMRRDDLLAPSSH